MAGEEPKSPFVVPPPPPASEPPPPKPPVAWQPFTPRGVAAFAFASYNRIFWIQTVFALGVAAAVVWSLLTNWAPVIRTAVRTLPDQGSIQQQRLHYPEAGPDVLAKNRYLGIDVRRDEFSTTAAGADVRVEFYPHAVRVCSILGCAARLYPADWKAPFTRQELIPWWAAWEPVFLGIAAALVAVGLVVLWHLLATVLCPIVPLIAYFADRQATWGGSWRLAGAAMLPGMAVLIVAILLYGVGVIDLLRLLLAVPIAFLVQLAYLLRSPGALPRLGTVAAKDTNPFAVAK